MKKKIVNVLLTAAVITTMMFSATACGSKADDVQNTVADAPVATQTADVNVADADTDTVDTDETTEADNVDADETVETDVADADEQDADAEDGVVSLEEWTETDIWAQFMEMMGEGMEDQGASIFYEVDGDVLTLAFQYEEQLEVAEGAEESIEELMSSLFAAYTDTFEMLRDEIISETGNENVVLRIEYRNADDSVLYGQDF